MTVSGCSGPELVGRLQARASGVKALYRSGYSAQSVGQATGIGPTDALVKKPFIATELLRQVRDVLDR